ncbi:Ribonuclease T2 [Geodia barretti]|uniref:Ribonuclease T2 n=2 Tax=Geodia barretti TaxID=519541 RepID=A0AA35RFI5_GEOBA|nr:Ribonuclease T2 [Geodia barretti]CAI8009395.1 Ribonuclease T2 [Geodia barretti]CAI8009396.1 Ribonuclease T2 [Geodia barretti]
MRIVSREQIVDREHCARSVMLAVAFLVLIVGLSTHAQQKQSVASQEFDFFVFVELSPGADGLLIDGKNCMNCTASGSLNLTIHGLWPTRNGCSHYLQYCNSSYEFNLEEIKSLTTQLEKFWPSLHKYANCTSHEHLSGSEYFWCHEWEAHGTCACEVKHIQGEFDFFQTVLELFEHQMNYDQYVLAKHGIVPSTTHPYRVEKFVDAFVAEWNVKPVLKCRRMGDGDRQVLDSIRTCLSKDFTHRQCTDCILDESTCDNGFYYYPA